MEARLKASFARSISDLDFRASPRYRLVLFDRLEADERELLRDLRRDPDFYGVLRPAAETGGTYKAVDRETALLLLTLREPGALPSYVVEGDADPGGIAELVMDGILEIRDGDRFVSGSEALPLLSPPSGPNGEGVLTRLSLEALRYAEALDLDDIEQLASRLYAYNRIPLTPRWQRLFPDAEAIADHLGLGPGGRNRGRVAARWTAMERRGPGDWLGWSRRESAPPAGSEPTFKLYVSPMPKALEPVFDALLDALAASRADHFKLGGDTAGLLRPDKLVVYFTDLDSLFQSAEELGRKLEGVPAHGVPFSAESVAGGLLSWGMDPPGEERTAPWRSRESWRLWVVRRLAASLVAARARPSSTRPWRFALERLRLAGVDVDRWIPDPTLWRVEA